MSADAGSAVNQVRNPFVDRPFVDRPFVDKPFVDRPFVDKPFVDRPFVDKPLVEMSSCADCPGASASPSVTGAPHPVSAVASNMNIQREDENEGMRGGLTCMGTASAWVAA
ncbi:hypothetical protein COSO111634_35630 [Corallococcus soli]